MHAAFHSAPMLSTRVPTVLSYCSTGISTCCPSATTLVLALGPDLPRADQPSSLTMLLPSALGFSPHPPVSVYGTGMCITIAAFLGTWLTRFPTLVRSTLRLRIVRKICCPYSYPACTGFLFPGSCSPHASPQFWVHIVQESPPVIHRLRLSTSP